MHEKMVQLQVITWREEQWGLYDYRTQTYQETHFKSIKYRFPIPRINHSVYYIIHQSTVKNTDNPFMFERRHTLQSNNEKLFNKNHYKVIGAFKIHRKESNRKVKVCLTAIRLKDIIINGQVWQHAPQKQCLPFWKWKVKEGQVIKFGRLQLTITEAYADPRDKRREEIKNGDILDLDQKYEDYSHIPKKNEEEQEEERRCRVCYMGDEENSQNILVNPCNCKGSIEFIHINCLRHWLDSRLTKVSLQTGGNIKVANKNCCELCKMRFPTRIIKNGQEIALINFIQQDHPFVSFSPLGIEQLEDNEMFYVTFGEEKQVRIGRLEESGVYLADQTVSRKHAILSIENCACILRDEESKYGTLAYEKDYEVKLGYQLRAFQINNSVYCFTCK